MCRPLQQQNSSWVRGAVAGWIQRCVLPARPQEVFLGQATPRLRQQLSPGCEACEGPHGVCGSFLTRQGLSGEAGSPQRLGIDPRVHCSVLCPLHYVPDPQGCRGMASG